MSSSELKFLVDVGVGKKVEEYLLEKRYDTKTVRSLDQSMPDHFHLLCKTRNRPLASSMRKILTGYVVNFNRRHRRYGHLFQNRYKSIVCQEDRYLKELVRYIHLNLLRAGLVRDIIELGRNPWSGHSALMGKVKRQWQDTDYVLSYFGQNRYCRRNYQRYVQKGAALGKRPELVGGGLVRSLGGGQRF